MKQYIVVILLLTLILTLGACSSAPADEEDHVCDYGSAYEDGYDAGWIDGATDSDLTWIEYMEEILADSANELEYEASQYARERSGWTPEEAMGVIRAYQNNEPLYNNVPPSEDDYLAAIESLYYFYEYFYGDRFDE